ncbi:carboxymuconolactone decarboxylase family protein [Halomonas ramblicola]|uniref:carboxymuconolactone decarboxylase family protein n=1 Tax=Halomonas ramblicola TaxID=747349 RepID=UPI0025B2DDBF|nr:carboxymuconolactone decarboxylase family protein [Halomonas ramblicola]MDN3523549.1 carboxymuconolactone decarboxylase family protein [Halomonas ramblicola]
MRMDYFAASPDALQPLVDIERYLARAARRRDELGGGLLGLLYTRVSQINGCAYCLDMHTKDARQAGESEQRLYALSAWRETPFFTPRERAALAWAEAHTLIADRGIDQALFDATRAHFSEPALVDLTLAICAINAWNRMAIGFAAEVGSYRPD